MVRGSRGPVGFVVAAFIVALVWTGSAQAVTRPQAQRSALKALGVARGSHAIVVFGLPRPVAAGTRLSEPAHAPTGAARRLRGTGVTTGRASAVLRTGERAWLFYEDQSPY